MRVVAEGQDDEEGERAKKAAKGVNTSRYVNTKNTDTG